MARGSLSFKGIPELSAKLKRNSDMTDVKNVVKVNTAELQTKSQRRVPVDTGNLKRSIRNDIQDNGMTGKVSATANYAGYIEWGTRFIYPRRYMGNSYFEQRKKFIKDMKRLMG